MSLILPAERRCAVPASAPAARDTWYATFILALVAMLAAADRNIMSVLLVPIQKDLGVSDAAMGALSGTAFAVVYATAALPLARYADRGNRRNLIAAAVAFWSAATMLCGVAASYMQMLLARVGVAAGEAAAGPATMSMIGDMYPAARRGMAVAVISVGGALGISVGATAAGALSDLHGWQIAFIAVGAPGLLVALLLRLTTSEPARAEVDGAAREPKSVWRSLKELAAIPSARTLLVAKILLNMAWGGWLLWVPTFFVRVHGMSQTEMSAWFGAVVGVSAIVSMLIAGWVSDRLARRGESGRVRYIVAALLVGIPLVALSCLVADPMLAWGLIFVYSLVTGGVTGVSITAGLGIVRSNMRAFMTAVMAFCVFMIGGGVGPFLFGAINDLLSPSLGDDALRYTLLASPAMLAAAAVAFHAARRTIDEDCARAGG